MASVLMPALLSCLAGNIVGLGRPGASPLSASFEAKGSMKGFARGPPTSATPGPSQEVGLDLQIPDSMDGIIKYKTYSREMSHRTLPYQMSIQRT